jgi:CcmD family protein
MTKRLMMALGSAFLLGVPLLGQQTPDSQSGYVPISELPPTDQLPAAPLLIAAYAFVWLGLAAYLWSIWSRLGRVERDMQALQQRRERKAR